MLVVSDGVDEGLHPLEANLGGVGAKKKGFLAGNDGEFESEFRISGDAVVDGSVDPHVLKRELVTQLDETGNRMAVKQNVVEEDENARLGTFTTQLCHYAFLRGERG